MKRPFSFSMRRVSTKPMSSKNAIVALMSVTRIIVCRYSIGSSSGFASSMASEHNASGLKGKPLDTWTTRFGNKAAPSGRRPLSVKTARGGGLDRGKHDPRGGQACMRASLPDRSRFSPKARITCIDIGASALTFFAVREADKPADADHPFGHAKIEAVAALAETGFLAVLSIGVAIEAVRRIRDGRAPRSRSVLSPSARSCSRSSSTSCAGGG